MSVSCNTFPTLTSTSQITTQTFSTSTTTSISSSPPTFSVSTTIGPCPTPPLGVTSTCIPTTTSFTVTIPGATQTVQVPITIAVDVTTQTLATLFGSSCTTINTRPPDTPPQTPPSPSPTPPPSSPPPVFTSESTSTQPNGSIAIQTITETSIQGVNTIASNDKDKDGSPNVAPIIGGAVGGFFGLLAIVALVWFILKRRRRWDDIFDKDDDDIIAAGAGRAGRFSLDVDVEPKPYQYGLVGQATAPSASSPPNSPPLRPSNGKGAPDINHARTSSLTPLTAGIPSTTPLTSAATTISSRPSTAGSQQPLYPPGSQQGYPFPHTHTFSNSSFSPPVSLAGWTGVPGSGPNPGFNGAAPAMMGMAMVPTVPSPEEYMYANRSGSPTSIQESQVRKLQVANVPPLSPASETFSFTDLSSSSSAAAAASASASASAAAAPVVQRDGKGRIRMSTGSSPLVHSDGGSVQYEPSATAGASSSSATAAIAAPPRLSGDNGASPPAYEE